MFGLFGKKKVACFQCDKKVNERETVYRRGFRFCSPTCVDAFLAANPLRPRGGDQASWLEQAKLNLGLAHGELARILKHCGVALGTALIATGAASLDVFAGLSAVQKLEQIHDAHGNYNTHVLNALPFLYGLGKDDQCARLETIDLDLVYDMKGGGPVQLHRIAKVVEPAAKVVESVVQTL